jgi:hypothetical protein
MQYGLRTLDAAGSLPQTAPNELPGEPYSPVDFAQIGVLDAWRKYGDRLSWGKGQCLAILDDGCDLSVPQWQAEMPWGKKVIATWNAIDRNDDPTPVPPGYHGTSVGYPSSLNHGGVLGVAYNDFVAHVRCVTVVHLTQNESATMAAALQWVIDHHQDYHITAVNLAPLDDQRHQEPVPTAIDGKLETLMRLGIWVSAPCGNHNYTDGISWPACQPGCWAIGATVPGRHEVHLDRFRNTDVLVAAQATSSSNAYAAACSMVLREAIEKSDFRWQEHSADLSQAIMAIFRRTGVEIHDPATGLDFRELDLLSALDFVFGSAVPDPTLTSFPART